MVHRAELSGVYQPHRVGMMHACIMTTKGYSAAMHCAGRGLAAPTERFGVDPGPALCALYRGDGRVKVVVVVVVVVIGVGVVGRNHRSLLGVGKVN